MSQSLVDVPLHFVFSTKDRIPFIKPEIEEELHQYICGMSRKLGCPIIKINSVEDHIHILLSYGKTITFSDLISKLKSSSSCWMKTKGNHYKDFSWQKVMEDLLFVILVWKVSLNTSHHKKNITNIKHLKRNIWKC